MPQNLDNNELCHKVLLKCSQYRLESNQGKRTNYRITVCRPPIHPCLDSQIHRSKSLWKSTSFWCPLKCTQNDLSECPFLRYEFSNSFAPSFRPTYLSLTAHLPRYKQTRCTPPSLSASRRRSWVLSVCSSKMLNPHNPFSFPWVFHL